MEPPQNPGGIKAGLTGLLAAALDWRDGHAKQRLEVIDARHGRSMPPRTSGLPRHSRHRAPMPAGQTRPQPVSTATSRTHDHAGTLLWSTVEQIILPPLNQ